MFLIDDNIYQLSNNMSSYKINLPRGTIVSYSSSHTVKLYWENICSHPFSAAFLLIKYVHCSFTTHIKCGLAINATAHLKMLFRD